MIAKRRKILIHSIVFSPDGVSTAYLYNDIALGFREKGYDVAVLTTTPHYNIVPHELQKQPMRKRWGGLYYTSDFQGIPVYHVPQKKFKTFPARAAGFVYWHIISFILGLFQKNLSLILSPSPPLTIALVSILLGKIKGAKVIYNVQEIYPDFLINKGSLTSPFLINLLKRLEKFVYRNSDKVTTIDEVFYDTIIDRFKDRLKLIIIPNFVDTEMYRPLDKIELSINREQFPDTSEYKVMYAGNIGHAQDWEPLINIAGQMKNEPVSFWVVGEGVLKEALLQEIETAGLKNIHVLPYQPREYMAGIINYADIHFIFMNPAMEGQGFPSKVYTIMACKKPLLVVSGQRTPLYQFLKNKQCAYLITEPTIEKKCSEIVTGLRKVIADRSRGDILGAGGFDIVKNQYSKQAVIRQYIDLVEPMLG